MRLLLIEDDRMIGQSIAKSLERGGHAVDWVYDGEDASEALSVNSYDIILLDLELPKKKGLEVLREARAQGIHTPVLILSASGEVEQRIEGLDSGADDYLVKPFSLGEMEARMRVLMRRAPQPSDIVLRAGSAELNTVTKMLTYNGAEYRPTAKEFQILLMLMERKGAVISKAQLEEKLYDWDSEVSSNTVEFHIHQLRKKTSDGFIKNIRGLGYTIANAV